MVILCSASVRAGEPVTLLLAPDAAPRVRFGAERLRASLESLNYPVSIAQERPAAAAHVLAVGTTGQSGAIDLLRKSGQLQLQNSELKKEGFVLAACSSNVMAVAGADDSGTLYGCLELARRIREAGKLPAQLRVADGPQFVMRGPCIGMQKTYILPGRHVYEYPYTPDLFPFFYDKEFWREYLDFLVDNRMNTLYLWNGHPFASLVKLPDYPYALEVPEEVFARNVEMFRYITQECDKRGIWLVQMFYNIIVSKPFAERNGISTQHSTPTPLTADYTRKSIAEFVKQYPNVGLMVCLGEALQGTPNQQNWCTNVVLPGVLDGMKAAGLAQPPPVVIRTHAMDADAVIPPAFQVYSNLFTESKYNGESLTTWEPRGKGQAIHLAMSQLSPHLVNIHILSNLEPFRYGDQQFIQKSMQAARDRLGATGVHLYPLAYWNWPDAPDIATPPLKQWQRDWIWYEAWGRYAWNPDVPADQDRAYWISRLAEFYGNTNAAEKILDAYNSAGECAPRLVRRFGITEGNRQTLSLGMTLDQLVNPKKYNVLTDLWESQSPPGERLQDYALKEWKKEPHEGETPPSIIREVLACSQKAVDAAEAAAPLVTRNREEFERLRNDTYCIRALCASYAAKVNAAMNVLAYNYDHDLAHMEQAQQQLAESFEHYQKLAALTAKTYAFANTMQTSQRKIPFTGGISGVRTNYHWVQLVPLYKKELENFQATVARLREKKAAPAVDESKIRPLPAAAFKILSPNVESYTVKAGERVFSDRDFAIADLAPELQGLTGMRIAHETARNEKYPPIEFEASEPVQVLVGYFQSQDKGWLQVPSLEFAAQADERGGIDPVIENAVTIQGCPALNVHAFRYGPGKQKLELIGKGSFVVLGVVPQSVSLPRRDAQRGGKL